MTPERKMGRATAERVHILPEIALDLFEGRPVPEGLGTCHAPVRILPGWSFDLCDPEPTPLLQLTLHFREGVPTGEVVRDLHQLSTFLTRLERSYGGSGLVAEENPIDSVPSNGRVAVVYRPLDLDNAIERLNRLVVALNNITRGQSIEKCEARVLPPAA